MRRSTVVPESVSTPLPSHYRHHRPLRLAQLPPRRGQSRERPFHDTQTLPSTQSLSLKTWLCLRAHRLHLSQSGEGRTATAPHPLPLSTSGVTTHRFGGEGRTATAKGKKGPVCFDRHEAKQGALALRCGGPVGFYPWASSSAELGGAKARYRASAVRLSDCGGAQTNECFNARYRAVTVQQCSTARRSSVVSFNARYRAGAVQPCKKSGPLRAI